MFSLTRQCLRRCTTSLSSRTIALSQTPRIAAAPFLRRHYSEQNSTEQEPGEAKPVQENSNLPNPLEEKLKVKEAEVADLTSRLRYLQADFLNLQRNTAREKEQMKDFAITKFASDLLEIIDVLAIALKSVPPDALTQENGSSFDNSEKGVESHLKDLHIGVEMTHRLLLQTLFKYHIKPFDPTGDKFDPNLHEALFQAPIPGKEPGTVLQTQKVGYMIKDRVLRAAQVGVVQDTS